MLKGNIDCLTLVRHSFLGAPTAMTFTTVFFRSISLSFLDTMAIRCNRSQTFRSFASQFFLFLFSDVVVFVGNQQLPQSILVFGDAYTISHFTLGAKTFFSLLFI